MDKKKCNGQGRASGDEKTPDAGQKDQHFDQLAPALANNIYNTYKGRFRLAFLREDLHSRVKVGQTLLDVGAGLAQLSAEFAATGVSAFAFDAAPEMQQLANTYAHTTYGKPWGDLYQVACVQSYEPPAEITGGFDWVLCHAVLAWLIDPQAALERLIGWIKPGGRLSVLFFNQHSIALKQIFRGRIDYLEKLWARVGQQPECVKHAPRAPYHSGGLTPQVPLDPDWMLEQLSVLGLEVELCAGVRCVVDYFHPTSFSSMSEEQMMAIERTYRAQLPYRFMARYIHVIAKKPLV